MQQCRRRRQQWFLNPDMSYFPVKANRSSIGVLVQRSHFKGLPTNFVWPFWRPTLPGTRAAGASGGVGGLRGLGAAGAAAAGTGAETRRRIPGPRGGRLVVGGLVDWWAWGKAKGPGLPRETSCVSFGL